MNVVKDELPGFRLEVADVRVARLRTDIAFVRCQNGPDRLQVIRYDALKKILSVSMKFFIIKYLLLNYPFPFLYQPLSTSHYL